MNKDSQKTDEISSRLDYCNSVPYDTIADDLFTHTDGSGGVKRSSACVCVCVSVCPYNRRTKTIDKLVTAVVHHDSSIPI